LSIHILPIAALLAVAFDYQALDAKGNVFRHGWHGDDSVESAGHSRAALGIRSEFGLLRKIIHALSRP
jgi:hypothetical protein